MGESVGRMPEYGTAPPGGSTSGEVGASSADLFASHHRKIRGYILSMVHDPVDADDLTQETFLRAHRKLDSVREPAAVTSWLYQIATHLCYDWYRKESRQPRFDPLDAADPAAAAAMGVESGEIRLDQVVEKAEMSDCVNEFLDGLSNDYRQVILLHDCEGLTNPEIAQMLGASLDAVKIRLHRARRKLRDALAAGCDFSYDENNVLICEPTSSVPLDVTPRHRG